ncbi:ABC transporter transmembrane domain-containing protein [Streptomyces profundus]|uniref:ABC transporter transmembrane domain-containing protein n=1 Tax=Streptomyces profundus TaxID=2867410 RepID=UPI001D16EC5C|nr:ABC transporter ATP-binding protein [Streptomyces sp. MA3_2.13]UED83309.1 ABC transporter ATP-binding protein/permease [Streptomyces sp. MA3_2.13]
MTPAFDAHRRPGRPDLRGPGRYLWWLAVRQRRRVLTGALLGSLWMLGLTVVPYLLSRAVDDGLVDGSSAALAGWGAALLAAGVLNAVLAIARHRTMSRVRMDASFRTAQLVVEHTTRLGAELPRTVRAGEVLTVSIGDVATISQTLTITGPGVGAVLSYAVVAGLLLAVSWQLALLVLLGVPLLALLVGPLLGRLQGAETAYRERQGRLTARVVDIVGGLRVLTGLGGKDAYAARFRAESAQLRAEGHRVGRVTSWIESLAVGLPALFLAAVSWLAARLAAQGEITVGELVAVWGYAAMLAVPVAFFVEGAHDLGRGLVAARRTLALLRLPPPPRGELPPPAGPAELHDPASGVRVPPGRLTALVSERPAEAEAVVDRLGGFAPSDATWGGLRLDRIAPGPLRERVLVADNDAALFAGTLREILAGRAERDQAAIDAAVTAALADEIVRGLPQGLDSTLDAQARDLSGGQRQRVRLARALLADPEVLLATEPTSAVDAHTEAAVAARLRAARSGRTTLLTCTSPLLLEQADTVSFLVDGRVAAHGPHHELLARHPQYHRLISRDAPPTETAPPTVTAVEPANAGDAARGVNREDTARAARGVDGVGGVGFDEAEGSDGVR